MVGTILCGKFYKFDSITQLRKFLNVSERQAKNIIFNGKEINGWKLTNV